MLKKVRKYSRPLSAADAVYIACVGISKETAK